MEIEYDPEKSAKNAKERGSPFDLGGEIEGRRAETDPVGGGDDQRVRELRERHEPLLPLHATVVEARRVAGAAGVRHVEPRTVLISRRTAAA